MISVNVKDTDPDVKEFVNSVRTTVYGLSVVPLLVDTNPHGGVIVSKDA
jgi:hypothetical protein